MAKKSAKSKGYRKQTAKKPYLSKRDIALLCALVVALIIGAFFLFRYDDGALKVQNGTVVTEGDNWLIVNGSNTRGRARYFKLGEMGDVEGFAREARSISTDANIPEYAFTPEAEDSGIASITVTSSHSASETLAKYAVSMLSEMENTDIGEIQSAELGGRSVSCFYYTTETTDESAQAGEDAEAQAEGEEAGDEAAATRSAKVLSGYFDAGHDSCIAIHVEAEANPDGSYPSDEALNELLAKVVSAVTLEETKE